MAPGLPHLPAPEDSNRVSEKRCAGCGHWNHPDEIRCQRCGRKIEASLGAGARRGLEETESLPAPAIPIAAAPRPAPEPEWKDELNRRLAGYRERQADRGRQAEADTQKLAASTAAESSLPAASAQTGPGDVSPLPPIRGREADEELPRVPEVVGKPRPASARVFDKYMESQGRLPLRPQRTPVEELLAPIGKRFIAGLLDLCVVGLAVGVFVAVTHLVNPAILAGPGALQLIAGTFGALLVLYWGVYLRLMGSTAGMHWTGLRVLNLDGDGPNAHQRWTRAFGTILSAAAVGVGFVWSLFDEQHFTWHDRLSKTFVAVDE